MISNTKKGFTLIEIMITLGILSSVAFIVMSFSLDIFNFQLFLSDNFTMHQQINLTLTEMGTEIRAIGPSANGSYAIESASDTAFAFYSDIDGDDVFERVRYYVENGTLKRGLIEPTGNPAVYLPANELTKIVVDNIIVPPIASQSLFVYYDHNYTGTQNPLPLPVSVDRIKLIKVTITADKNPQDGKSRLDYSSMIMMRNLRNTQ